MERGSRFATLDERLAVGRAIRKQVPRTSQATWTPRKDRPDPIALLDGQNKRRVAGLVPIRWGRMLESAFAFMRGSALVMATDLATTPNTGIKVQACGDSHLLNFGAYATPERNLVFDINDFDETLVAPWEWDVKRLATSIEFAGRYNTFSRASRADAVRAAVCSYREFMAELAEMTALQVWYSRLDPNVLERRFTKSKAARNRHAAAIRQSERRTMESAFIKMTKVANGRRRIVDDPPGIFHLRERHGHPLFSKLLQDYLATARDDVRVLLDRYRVVDFSFKVVGVGSVGTRCGVILMMANDGDPLLLQVKEANRSVLDVYAGKSKYRNNGHRVVTGQRVMQAASDMFLGWTSLRGRDYYVRQLRDMKWSQDLTTLDAQGLADYAKICGATLARAHAKSTDPAVLSGYLGNKGTFDDALVEFARLYADQGERDFEQLQTAAKSRRITAAQGSAAALTLATTRAFAASSNAFS